MAVWPEELYPFWGGSGGDDTRVYSSGLRLDDAGADFTGFGLLRFDASGDNSERSARGNGGNTRNSGSAVALNLSLYFRLSSPGIVFLIRKRGIIYFYF